MKFTVVGGNTEITLSVDSDRLKLVEVANSETGHSYLHAASRSWAQEFANPLILKILKGKLYGTYSIQTDFSVTQAITTPENGFEAKAVSENLNIELVLRVESTSKGVQWSTTIWNRGDDLEMEVYFPMFLETMVTSAEVDKVHFPQIAGITLSVEERWEQAYMGQLAAPFLIQEGENEGLCIIDENRNDFLSQEEIEEQQNSGETPFAMRTFISSDRIAPGGGEAYVGHFLAEKHTILLKSGQRATLGPILTIAFTGSRWRALNMISNRRKSIPFRSSPEWMRNTYMIGEHGANKETFQADLDYGRQQNALVAADLFHYYSYWEGDGKTGYSSYVNRGDYLLVRHDMGGSEALREAIERIHSDGGRIIFYVEGMIVWRHSSIGDRAREWALMNADGSYFEVYHGFWHMCPACEEWQNEIANICAGLVREFGIDGVFIDSSCATGYHPCYNEAHGHPSPFIWNWGVREMFRKIRAAMDEINPDTVILAEGAADLVRQYVDGFLSHGHSWTNHRLVDPLVRAVYPLMNNFESWGSGDGSEQRLLWNFATGHRIYSHASMREQLSVISHRVRKAIESCPEILTAEMRCPITVRPENVFCFRFDAGDRTFLTLANPMNKPISVIIPALRGAKSLYDRVTNADIQIVGDRASMDLIEFDARVLEVKR